MIVSENKNQQEIKYLIITELFYLLFEPIKNDMSLAKLIQCHYLKDLNFILEEKIDNKEKDKNKNKKNEKDAINNININDRRNCFLII